MVNSATLTMTLVDMQYGKARHNGGAINCRGIGATSITFSNCVAVSYFESFYDGGLIYLGNP